MDLQEGDVKEKCEYVSVGYLVSVFNAVGFQ